MKYLKLSILFVFILSNISFAEINSNDLDNLKNDLNKLLGKRFYILNSHSSDNKVTVIIFKRFDVTYKGEIIYHEYPKDMLNFLSKNINNSYNFNIIFEISPYAPPSWIEDSIRKENIKNILLLSLIGVIAIYVGFIIFRFHALKSKNKIQPHL